MDTSRANIVEEILTYLGAPDRLDIRNKINARIDLHLQTCTTLLPFPDAAAINKLAKDLDDAVALFPDMPIPVEGGGTITMREFRYALRFLRGIEGPSRKIDQEKILAGHTAAALSRELSTRDEGRYEAVQAIAELLYRVSSSNRKPRGMKRAVDRVNRWRKPHLNY